MNEGCVRQVSIPLNEGDERMTVEFSGSPCACEDFQMAVIEFARTWRRDLAKRKPARGKPCDCKDEKDAG